METMWAASGVNLPLGACKSAARALEKPNTRPNSPLGLMPPPPAAPPSVASVHFPPPLPPAAHSCCHARICGGRSSGLITFVVSASIEACASLAEARLCAAIAAAGSA